MRLLARLATAALLTVPPIAAGSASAAAPEPTPAPLLKAENPVPGKYIVTLQKGQDAAKVAKKLGLKPSFVYTTAMSGFAVPLTSLELTLVRNSLGVEKVEEDASVQSLPMPTSPAGTRAPSNSWGQDRIDQKELPLDNSFTTEGNGAGVTAYILDTGIDYKHTEFGDRATFGYDAIGDGRNGQDCQGHGTHVAGTVAGRTYGVARKANLVSVRVLGCDGKGTWSGIIAGMDWIAKNAKQPAVMNGSLGGDRSEAVNNAATALSDAGVLPVIAAGNSAKDACNVSPASAARVITVAASNEWDEETDFSNYGTCVSLYAPGQAIVSAKLGGGSVALDGTSMAAPHVAGVAALYKQAHPNADPAELNEFLDSEATKDVLKSVSKTSPNVLLNSGGL
ncbi:MULTISPECIES: S8 family peptidase [unclassified Streptomyces]|uniref:S8 family peptidase n=1 Tax=unclassified Streptomyces TaxID=2593676 RepID=UPI002255B177|nr:S8 family peptidase [Streptomyces sp. NBC_00047]MCX5606532.1 S8 family peptidase [Streptomyces sp. NBC_00047]